jgi:hypothetical protein
MLQRTVKKVIAMYGLFEGKKQIGPSFETEREVWEAALIAALIEGHVTNIPVADENGGQILPRGYSVGRIEEICDPRL